MIPAGFLYGVACWLSAIFGNDKLMRWLRDSDRARMSLFTYETVEAPPV